MNFERMFRATMTETVTLEPVASTNSYDEDTYGTAVTYAAWISRKPKEVRTAAGELRAASTEVWLAGRVNGDGSTTDLADLAQITPEWRLTLPDNSQPPIIAVGELRDPQSDRHVVLYC